MFRYSLGRIIVLSIVGASLVSSCSTAKVKTAPQPQEPAPAPAPKPAPPPQTKTEKNVILLKFSQKLIGDGEMFIEGNSIGTVEAGAESFKTFHKLGAHEKTRCMLVEIRFNPASPVRCAEFITVQNTESAQAFTLDISAFPGIDILVDSALPTKEEIVYAGDKVNLSACGDTDDKSYRHFWIAFSDPATRQLNQDFRSLGKPPANIAGIRTWLSLRGAVSKELGALFSSKASSIRELGDVDPARIFSGLRNSRYLGEGSSVHFTPDQEGRTALCLLSYNGQGKWQLASRDVFVMDIRPVVWMLPALPILDAESISSLDKIKDRVDALDPSDSQIYQEIAQGLSRVRFSTVVGNEVSINLTRDPYFRAETPLAAATVSVNGGPAKDLDLSNNPGATFRFLPATSGMHRVTLITKDVMGLQRQTFVQIFAAERPVKPDEPKSKVEETKKSPESQIIADIDLEIIKSPYELFRQVSASWADQAVFMMQGVRGKKIAINHIHSISQVGLVDLFDHILVSRLLKDGHNIYERNDAWMKSLNNERGTFKDKLIDRLIAINIQGMELSAKTAIEADMQSDDNLTPPAKTITVDDVMNLYNSKEFKDPQPVDLLLNYQLKRAGVFYENLGPLTIRRASLMAFVRLHNMQDFRIIQEQEIRSEFSDCVFISSGRSDSNNQAWDDYPPNFMRNDKDLEFDAQIADPRANETPPPAPASNTSSMPSNGSPARRAGRR